MESTSDDDHPDLITTTFQKTMSLLLNEFTPLRNKKARFTKNKAKWFNEELKTLLSAKRKAEQTWLHSRSDTDKVTWKAIAHNYKKLIQATKKEFYNERIEQASNDTKELFTILRETDKPLKEPLPFTPSADDCQNVQKFFANKIKLARDKIINRQPLHQPPAPAPLSTPDTEPHKPGTQTDTHTSFKFKPTTQETILKTLKSMKPCPDNGDFFPSKIIIKYAEIFTPLLTRIINSSFSHATIPASLKSVRVTPIPKKPKANLKDPANLRPITTVMFLLKLLDKIATAQLHDFTDTYHLLHPRQSGFRRGFSTETALLDLQTKLRSLLEENKAGLLVLLDLSAAFDLVDHQILLNRLQSHLSFDPTACTWLHSFLSGRQSKVSWGEAESPPETLLYGVPQGSCLSPTLFNIYLTPLFDLLEKQNIVFTNYADDTQLLLELSGNHTADSLLLNSTYDTIKKWMDLNWMCLNGSKTELLIVSTKQKRARLGPDYQSFTLDSNPITVATKVKTLGVIFDANLTMSQHCSTIYNAAQYHLKLLRAIRPCLTTAHSATIARATIMPRLDYCNSLLNNTAKVNTQKLQAIQNAAVRIVAKIPKREHITEARRNLHWLPVSERINFKILSITHRCIQGTAPVYLSTSIIPTPASRILRSNTSGTLYCPKAMKKCGNRSSFAYSAPHAWNNLPRELRLEEQSGPFKKMLKTHLFT